MSMPSCVIGCHSVLLDYYKLIDEEKMNQRPKLNNPSFQTAQSGQQDKELEQLEGMYKHKFTWMDDSVDIRDECPMCMLYVNSPCADTFNEFNKVDDLKHELKSSLRTERTAEKEAEYKLVEKKSDLTWDRLMKCVLPQQEMFVKRQEELQGYMKYVKEYETKVFENEK